jgi:hypothetical protein
MEGWQYILNAEATDYAMISDTLKTCAPVTHKDNLTNLYYHLMNGYAYMAMTNYPYPTSFLEPMPAWPVTETKYSFVGIDPLTAEIEEQSSSLLSQAYAYISSFFTTPLKDVTR